MLVGSCGYRYLDLRLGQNRETAVCIQQRYALLDGFAMQ